MEGQTNATGYFTGGQVVTDPERVWAAILRPRFLCRQPGGSDARPAVTFEGARRSSTTASTCRTPGGSAPGLTVNVGLRWDGEETRNYAGQTVLRFTNDWQPRDRHRLGPVARRERPRCPPSPGASPTRCRRRGRRRGVQRLHRASTTLQLRPGQRRSDPTADLPQHAAIELRRAIRRLGGRGREGVLAWTS